MALKIDNSLRRNNMKSYGYPFREFEDKVVDVDNANDPVKQQIIAVAEKNGLTVKFAPIWYLKQAVLPRLRTESG